MKQLRFKTIGCALASLVVLAGCGGFRNTQLDPDAYTVDSGREAQSRVTSGTSLLDIFDSGGSSDVKVNRFIWTATLDVLDFLPVEAADPFTGVISTGYGRPPGGGSAYRATVLVSDPALDARSLNVALQTRSGPVSAETQRAVEDAILARARQLRIRAENF
ncbi:DUF3576 domain-containing protein [Roseovarius sp. SYSU LYC5161]|uniref:DUF3576 domain-containing protein n=1 Tax=Roseovarius halophilus (ex Wu et al. 2025) TaxID=3376060 RepID=UPI002872459E|nr:DUF3576 domain-containing protein [Roseovarius sp.]